MVTASCSSPASSSSPSPSGRLALRERLRERALAAGFARVGFCDARPSLDPDDRLPEWLAAGRHAGMNYLARDPRSRADATAIVPGACTIVVAAAAYPSAPDSGIAAYARTEDYHRALHQALDAVLAHARELDRTCEGRVCVDTRPLLERAAAARAGLGWIGKNTMLLHEQDGPWLMLGALVLTLELPPDAPAKDRCGTCTRCLDACPTDAFVAPYVLDARRCLSYWSIEHRGPWPEWIREKNGARVFGCDDCLDACPFGPPRDTRGGALLRIADPLRNLTPEETLRRVEEGFNRHFKGFAIARAGKAGLLRNAITALGHRAGDGAAAARVRPYLTHADRGVRTHAAWALGRIGIAADRALLLERLSGESDVDVRSAIERAAERLPSAGDTGGGAAT